MSGIFISYRREDSAGFAGRLADALEIGLGADRVFRDVDDIRPGQDFADAIETQLRQMDVVLVLIGPQWSDIARDGVRRLEDPSDFVRLEIRLGLALGAGDPGPRRWGPHAGGAGPAGGHPGPGL